MHVHVIVKNTRTIDMTIDQQVALDEALVPHASRLRTGKSNFRLRSDITSKESTLQLVYEVLRLTPFFKAFLATADVPEIYMQEFWATATVHHHFIRFKMDNKKRIVNLEYFREMMHICPRLPGQTFDDLPFEEEILAFLRFLGHSGEIRKLIDVNINKLHQPWRSFAAIINKCLSRKSTGYDSLQLSQAQILWGLYHKKNVDFAYLLWEDFVYQVEHKDAKKSNICTIPGLQRDDQMFTTIKLVSRHQNTQQFGVMLPIEITNKDIRNFEAYKEYYAVASGAAPPKTKTSVRKTKSSFDTSITPPTAAGTRLLTSVKGKQPAKASKAKSLTVLSEDAEDDEDGLYRDVNINLEERVVQMADVYTTQEFEDTHVTLTLVNRDDGCSGSNYSGLSYIVCTNSHSFNHSHHIYSTTSTNSSNNFPEHSFPRSLNFGLLFGFDHRLKTLEANFSEFVQTNQFAGAVSSIPGIVQRYMDQRMNKAVKNLDENIQKIIKKQVKEQVKVQVSKILPKIEKIMNEYLEAEVLTQSSNSSKTSYAVAADLSEMELKKILIEKTESNKDVVMMMRTKMKNPPLDQTGGPKGDADDQPIAEASQHPEWFQQQKKPSTPDRDWNKTLPVTHGSIQPWISELAKQAGSRSSFNELMDTPGTCKSLVELEFFLEEVYKATTDQLDWNNPEGQQYPHNLLKPLPLIPNSRGRRVITFDHFVNNDLEYLCGGASSRKDDDKLYKFKEGDFKRLRIQDIEDMLLFLVQEKLTNLTVEERFAFNVSLRMFTRSIVIQGRVKDLQLGVESYQKKLNLTKPDTYRFDLKRKEACIAYSNPRGFIYQNKDKQNRLMQIDELHNSAMGRSMMFALLWMIVSRVFR
nr:hypothetical protein [Tanacetum cinerariifolium]